MIYRRASANDAEAVANLIYSFRSVLTLDRSGRGAEEFLASVSAEAERSYITSDRFHYLVAEADSSLAGFIAMRDRTHLFHLFIEARFQSQGLAGELWRRAHASACQPGLANEFTVNSTPLAVPVYMRFGFEQCSPRVETHGIAFIPMRLKEGSIPPNNTLERSP